MQLHFDAINERATIKVAPTKSMLFFPGETPHGASLQIQPSNKFHCDDMRARHAAPLQNSGDHKGRPYNTITYEVGVTLQPRRLRRQVHGSLSGRP